MKPGLVRNARLLLAPLVALLIAGIAASTSFGLMGSLDRYHPTLPFERLTADADVVVPPASLAPTRTARRVLLVVVDGLRADTADGLPYLNELRQSGFSGRLIVDQPSYSKPGYAAIATGAGQEISGVVLNSHAGLTPAETLFTAAAKNGLTTAAVADDWWGELCGSAVTFQHYYPDATFDDPATDERTTAGAISSLSSEDADLTLVHYAATDTQAHQSGGAASPEYAAAALRIDGFIRDLAAQLDLSQDAIVVTSDHGHLSRNMGPGSGHGGWEAEVLTVPLVAAGAGIKPGALSAPAAAIDLTPTVAALLGTPSPAESKGSIIFPLLTVSGEPQAALAVARAQRLAILAPAYTAMFGSAGPAADADLVAAINAQSAGDYATAFARAEASVNGNQAVMTAARRSAVAHGRTSRLTLAIFELVALVAALYGAARLAGHGRRLLPLICGGAYLILDSAIYRGIMHGTYSLGALTGSDIGSMLRLFALPAYIAALVVVAGALLLVRATARSDRVALVEATLTGCGGAGFVLAIYGLWLNGTAFQPLLPDFRMAFLTLTYMLKGTFLAAPFVILPALAAVWPVKRPDAKAGTGAATGSN